MEMARYLLFEKGLPKTLRAKAVNKINYLLNLAPTKALTGKTPYEALLDVKPIADHFKVLGCICYAKDVVFNESMRWNWISDIVESLQNHKVVVDYLQELDVLANTDENTDEVPVR
ncbi:Uncharacterized protein TCM_033747 [Theobroma cacao]|uniref:Uncharacterized protein n=1 Tax=Theobroma cacao TaxID=3641 RepID=A0A061FAH8_THECC|nr:Uncharacterized protein TCM_033747 [Theobroma cacao]